MAVAYKVVIDCVDPHRQAAFWAEALGYVVEDHSAMIRGLLDAGHVDEDSVVTIDGRLAWREFSAVRDPEDPAEEASGIGQGRRVLFQVVPEPKTAKNRVHLDLHVGQEARDDVVDRLTKLGARRLWDGELGPLRWVTMADPEGNEFCVS